MTEAQEAAQARIADIRKFVSKTSVATLGERWTNALFSLMEVKRQIGELEALIKREANLVDEAAYLRVAQGKGES